MLNIDYKSPEFQRAISQYSAPTPTSAPAPVRTPTVQPMTAAATPVAGIGSPAPVAPAVEPMTVEAEAPVPNTPLTLAQLAARVAPGRDPSQREQIIASQNLVSTPYSINNYLEYGNGQGVAGGTPTTTGLYAGHNYTLVDNKTGTILAQGSTPEEIQKIQQIANSLSATQGQKADWRLYDANPQSGITNMHEKMPGAYLDLSTPGDPRGVVVAGNMPNNVFKDFIIPALTPIALAAGAYFGGGALLGQLGGAGGGAAAGAGATATGAGTAATGGLTAAQTAALSSGLASAFPATAAAGTAATAASALAPIVVTGGATTAGLTAGQIAALAGGLASVYPATAVGSGASSNVANGVDQANGDIVVSKARPYLSPEALAEVMASGAPTSLLPDNFFDPVPEKTLIQKIKDAANLANTVSTVVPIVGGLLGSGSDSGGTRSPDTTGLTFTNNPLRQTLTGNRTGIGGTGNLYPYTPQTYGRAGGNQETEYMFFTRNPVTGAPMAPVTAPAAPAMILPPSNVFAEGGEIDDDMVKHLVDYHKNGGHQGPGKVKGIGSGQEDKIPAYLSDGEYVWSAQDVSDLGDGSNDEGVRRLDKMRQMVRSQAGRKDVKKIAKPQKGIDRMLKAVGGMA